MNADEQQFVRFLLEYIGSFTKLEFTEVRSNGDMVFGKHNMIYGGYASYPPGHDVFLSDENPNADLTEYMYQAITHEIGHSLGLAHARAYGDTFRMMPEVPVEFDTGLLSTMSYSQSYADDPYGDLPGIWSLRVLDIAALIHMYGAETVVEDNIFKLHEGFGIPSRSENTWHISGELPFVVVDSGGHDIIDASELQSSSIGGTTFLFDRGLYLDEGYEFDILRFWESPGSYEYTNIVVDAAVVPVIEIFDTTIIEEFIGTPLADIVYGNQAAQTARTGGGDDEFFGNGGDDLFEGGSGFDIAIFSGILQDYELISTSVDKTLVRDLRFDSPDGADTLIGVELAMFSDGETVRLDGWKPPAWLLDTQSIELVASIFQFFTGAIPEEKGFEYLIHSPINQNDLNDPSYAQFNLENRFFNLANTLGTEGDGAASFESKFGALDYEGTIKTAYLEIMGRPVSAGALDFFLNAESYYGLAAELRGVVRPGVDLAEATKIVAIGSILNAAIISGEGSYAGAIADFLADVTMDGHSQRFGGDLFAVV
jgi:hypothetical protein